MCLAVIIILFPAANKMALPVPASHVVVSSHSASTLVSPYYAKEVSDYAKP